MLFNARGEAVLSDFGLVKSVETSAAARSVTMGVIGTASYIPLRRSPDVRYDDGGFRIWVNPS